MIVGHVENLHAVVPVLFRLGQTGDLRIDFVVDTGFTGFLTLPPAAVVSLQLPYLEDTSASLANDSQVPIPVYAGTIIWNGKEQDVRVLATGSRPLLGTALLDGFELTAQFRPDGRVNIREI